MTFHQPYRVAEEKKKQKIDPRLLSLYTHWITADAIKERVRLNVVGGEDQIPKEIEAVGQAISKVQTLTVFYALFYVVVEVYRGLNLRDTAIDTQRIITKTNFVVSGTRSFIFKKIHSIDA